MNRDHSKQRKRTERRRRGLPPSFVSDGGSEDDLSPDHEQYGPRALTREQREELGRRNEQFLNIAIIGMTPEALAMESTHLATLAKRDSLERLKKELDDRARRQPSSSRHKRWLYSSDQPRKYQVLSTPLQTFAAATRIADSIQPSGSTAEEGIWHIQALLKTVLSQNAAVSQSRDWIHIA